MKKIAVYGSLRKGFGNHRLIEDYEPISTEVVSIPFRMISFGGFPGLVPSENNNEITIEIYEVDDATYRSVERLEGYPSFYQKALIPTSEGEVEVYVLEDKSYLTYPRVDSGDWKEHKNLKYSY